MNKILLLIVFPLVLLAGISLALLADAKKKEESKTKKMELVTKEQYNEARKVIASYEKQEREKAQKALDSIKIDLAKYFKENKVGGMEIKSFELDFPLGFHNNFSVIEIVPTNPHMDEEYGDDAADDDIADIGAKYGKVLHWHYGIYSK